MHLGLVTDVLSRGSSSYSLYVRKLAENLAKVAPKSFDLTLVRNGRQEAEPFTAEKELKSNLYSSLHSLYSYFTISPIRLRRYRFDLIHIPHMGGGGTPPIAYHLVRSPIVYTLHGVAPLSISPHWYFAGVRDHYLYRCLYAYFILVYKLIKNKEDIRIITVSDSEKRLLQRYLPACVHEKIRVIHHGVDHSLFKVLRNRDEVEKELAKRYGIKTPYIFHISSYHPKKNLGTLLHAFHILKKTYNSNIKLVLAGHTHGRINKLLETAGDLGLLDELTFTGYIPEKDLPKLYNCADLFVFPSLHESFGLPLLEAMACGTPIVVSNRFAIPEIVGNAEKLVDPLDVNALAKAMYMIIDNDEIRKDLVKKGLKRAKTFTWEKCAREHIKVYEEVVR